MYQLTYNIIVRPDAHAGYLVRIPALPGCITCGGTYEQAIAVARDIVENYLAGMSLRNRPIPIDSEILPTSLNVTVRAPLPVIA